MRGLFIPVSFDLKTARQSLQSLITEAKKSGSTAGKVTGEEYLKEFKTAFATKSGAIKEAVARGFIDKSEARRLGQEAAKEFNAGISAELDRMRTSGKGATAEFDKLQRSLKSVGAAGASGFREANTATQIYQRSLVSLKGALGGIFAYFTARTVFNFFKDSMKQAEEASRSWGVLAANVEAAGVSFAQVQPEIERMATSVQKTTRFSDEEFADALSNVITITNDYSRSLKSMDVVLDLAAAKQIDLHTASQLVGKAIVGNTTMLQRYGIIVHEGADAVQIMRDRWHGLAVKDGETLSGRLKSMNNLWGEFKEAIGGAILGSDTAAESIGDMKDALIKATDWVHKNAAAFETWIGVIARVGSELANLAVAWAQILDPTGMQSGAEMAMVRAQGNAQDPTFLRERIRLEQNRLAQARKDLAQAEKNLEVVSKSARGKEGVNAILQQTDAIRKLNEVIEVADKNFIELNKDLARAVAPKLAPPKDKPLEETDAQKAKRLAREKAAKAAADKLEREAEANAKKRLDVEERLQDMMAKLAVTTTDSMLLELNRLRDDWIKTHGQMDMATAASFMVLKKNIEDTTQVEKFAKELHDLGQVEIKTADDAEMLSNAVTEYIRTLADESVKFKEGTKIRTDYNKLIEDAIKLQEEIRRKQKEAGDTQTQTLEEQNRKLKEHRDKVRDAARQIQEYAQAVIQVAQAFGVLDDQAAKTLESIVQIGTAIARVAEGDLTAIPSLLGGVASLANSIFGGGDDHRAEDERKAQQELIDSLHDLAKTIESTMSGKGPLQSATESIAADVFAALHIAKPRGSASPTPTLADARAQAAQTLDFVRINLHGKPGDKDLLAQRAALEKIIQDIDDFVERMTKAVNEDLDQRELAAQGYEYELQRRELASAHEAELRDAELAGLDAATVERMRYVQGLENEAQAEAERAAALEFGVALLERQAAISGSRDDAIAAAHARAQLQADQELATAQRLLDQGVITREMFEALAKILGEDVVNAVEAAQAAFDDLAATFEDKLSVRKLRVAGDEKGASLEEFKQTQRDELKAARDLLTRGAITQSQFDAFVQLQADEMAAFLASLEDKTAPAPELSTGGGAEISDAALGKTIESVTGITGTQAVGILDYARIGIGIDQMQLEELRTIRQILSGSGRAEGGPVAARHAYIVGEKGPELFLPGQYGHILPDIARGSVVGAPTVNIDSTINFHGAVGNPNAVAQEISAQIVSKMNTALGAASLREKRLSGDVML